VSSRNIRTADPALLVRAIDIYEHHRMSFADAYLVALAEASDEGRIASFDRGIDRAGHDLRVEPV
jgi:predicted nucleic acid-binding protein